MSVDRVSITPLNTLYFENLLGLPVEEQAKLLEGSDLYLDKDSGALKRLTAGKPEEGTESLALEQEVEYVRMLRGADANQDGNLVVPEIQLMLRAALGDERAAQIDPQAFLDAIDVLMKSRYAPISENVKQFRGALAFRPTLEALEIYSHGLFLDDMLRADAVFSPSSILTKTTTNIAFFVPKLAVKIFDRDTSVLQGDKWASDKAKTSYESRNKSLQNLKAVINKGVEDEEPWALEGDLRGAMAKLSAGDRENIGDRMVANTIHDILMLEDPKERYLKLKEFAVRERPGFAGLGGGNASGWNFWNVSGKHNNLYFAKTALGFILSKAATGDSEFDNTMRLESRNIRKDMMGGSGAGFNNVAAVGITGIGCGIAWIMPWTDTKMSTCVTDYQPWGDEDKITLVGRSFEIGLLTFGGMRFLTRAGQFNRLRKVEGWGSAGSAWLTGLKQTRWARSFPVLGWNLFGGKHLAKAAEEAQELMKAGALAPAEASRIGRAFNVLATPFRWTWGAVTWPVRALWAKGGKAWTSFVEKTGPLSPEAKAMLDKAGKAAKTLPWWVRGTLVLSVATGIDAKNQPYYNPYDLKQEADFDRYPDPTKPRPLK